MTELQWEPIIEATDIGVSVTDGVMTLSGYVDSFWKKWAAGRAATRVFGVKAVAEKIQVRLPGSLKRSDEDLARAASDALEWNVGVPHDRVKVQAQDGVVTLSGEVDWWHQKDAAEDAVRKLVGVVLLSNLITITPAVKPQDVKDKIESAFQRNALLDARRVTVETHGGKVILRGSVRNSAEKDKSSGPLGRRQVCPRLRAISRLVPSLTESGNHKPDIRIRSLVVTFRTHGGFSDCISPLPQYK
jgi:osmotically-inducible protein OsmY